MFHQKEKRESIYIFRREVLCVSVCVCQGGYTIKCVCVCVFGDLPNPMSSQPPPVPGSAQQLQGCSLQQWCPHTTHYLEGFSLSRCCSGGNGVKFRWKERLGSNRVSLSPAIHVFRAELHRSRGWEGGRRHFVPRVCIHAVPLAMNARRRHKDVEFHRDWSTTCENARAVCTFVASD